MRVHGAICVPNRRPFRFGALIVLAAAFVACDTATASPAATAAEFPPPATAEVVPASPVPSPIPAPPDPTTAPTPTTTTAAVVLQRDSVARTVVDRVRVRSAPGTGADSEKYKPLLPKGAELYVLEGPVAADGYDWYKVAPLDVRGFERLGGWVAVASRDGEPWLREASPTCPSKPDRFAGLVALSDGQRLACFGGVPLTVRARILECRCDRDPGYSVQPEWFHEEALGDWWGGLQLVRPNASEADPFGDSLDLVIDPDGAVPDEVPVGDVVTVTGMFDHPDASPCVMQMAEAPPDHDFCRLRFAVTRMR